MTISPGGTTLFVRRDDRVGCHLLAQQEILVDSDMVPIAIIAMPSLMNAAQMNNPAVINTETVVTSVSKFHIWNKLLITISFCVELAIFRSALSSLPPSSSHRP